MILVRESTHNKSAMAFNGMLGGEGPSIEAGGGPGEFAPLEIFAVVGHWCCAGIGDGFEPVDGFDCRAACSACGVRSMMLRKLPLISTVNCRG